MIISSTQIPDVVVIEPKIFKDDRGYFYEHFKSKTLSDYANKNRTFLQDNISFSYKNILRGLHYQLKIPQAKWVTCLKGAIFDVAVDIRKDSPTLGKYVGIELSESNKKTLFIPEGFAHGFLALDDENLVHYKCSSLYDPKSEFTIRFDDPEIQIAWPKFEELIISDKDKNGKSLSFAKANNLLIDCNK